MTSIENIISKKIEENNYLKQYISSLYFKNNKLEKLLSFYKENKVYKIKNQKINKYKKKIIKLRETLKFLKIKNDINKKKIKKNKDNYSLKIIKLLNLLKNKEIEKKEKIVKNINFNDNNNIEEDNICLENKNIIDNNDIKIDKNNNIINCNNNNNNVKDNINNEINDSEFEIFDSSSENLDINLNKNNYIKKGILLEIVELKDLCKNNKFEEFKEKFVYFFKYFNKNNYEIDEEDILFKSIKTNIYELNSISNIFEIKDDYYLTLFVLKIILIIFLCHFKNDDSLNLFNKLLDHKFENNIIQNKFEKFLEIINCNINNISYNEFENIVNKQSNPFNLLKILLSLLNFITEFSIIKYNHDYFDRKSLFKTKPVYNFCKSCTFIDKMRLNDDEIKINWIFDISDTINSYGLLLYLVYSIDKDYSVKMINKLKFIYENIKFKNTVQEIIFIKIFHFFDLLIS